MYPMKQHPFVFILWAIVVAAAAACLPGCLAMDLIPAGGPPGKPPEGVTAVRFDSTDGVVLTGWLHKADSGKFDREMTRLGRAGVHLPEGGLVVFCHGVYDSANSNMCEFLIEAGVAVLSFDYRGFGDSTLAEKTNLGFADDALAALHFARSLPGINPKRVVLYGHSLGGIYAMAAASKAWEAGDPVRGVATGGTFSNWRSVSNHLLPVLGLLLGGVWGPEPTFWAARLGYTPLLIVHASNDKQVPPFHAAALAEAARNGKTPVQVFMAAGGGHVSGYLPELLDLSAFEITHSFEEAAAEANEAAGAGTGGNAGFAGGLAGGPGGVRGAERAADHLLIWLVRRMDNGRAKP